MADSITALRASVFSALVSANIAGATVSKYPRRGGTARRSQKLLEVLDIAGFGRESATVTLRATVGGERQEAALAALEVLTQAAENALPAQVGPPTWAVSYDSDGKVWQAVGAAEAFRE